MVCGMRRSTNDEQIPRYGAWATTTPERNAIYLKNAVGDFGDYFDGGISRLLVGGAISAHR